MCCGDYLPLAMGALCISSIVSIVNIIAFYQYIDNIYTGCVAVNLLPPILFYALCIAFEFKRCLKSNYGGGYYGGSIGGDRGVGGYSGGNGGGGD